MTRGVIQAVSHGPGPMTQLLILTDEGSRVRVPCATSGLPPQGVELVYWEGPSGALLGWARAEVWDARHEHRNRYEPSSRAVEGCGDCGGHDVTLRDDGDPATEAPGVGLRPWCRTCQGWAD